MLDVYNRLRKGDKMQGDKIKVTAEAIENNGEMEYASIISEKPIFMVQQEYNQSLIRCACKVVNAVCKAVYPNNEGTQKVLAEAIANHAFEEI